MDGMLQGISFIISPSTAALSHRKTLPGHRRTAINKHSTIVWRRVGQGAFYGSYFHFPLHFKCWWKWQAFYFVVFTFCQFDKL